ncbi:hypothetical protein DFH29DRAFT_30780 [Suillus ampliporus]|nr:hypothetical protein DFH29DRAFT_30780 [Suillus ampliporus]
MEKAYNRLIMTGLPRDAPAVVDDFEELRTRPKRPEKVPAWAEAIIPLDKVMDILDSVETVRTLMWIFFGLECGWRRLIGFLYEW